MHKSLAIVAALMAVTNVAMADQFVDNARVVSARPIYSQDCSNHQVQSNSGGSGSVGGSIIGGIAGAILGNQVGGGSGRTVATAAGAVTGAMVGNSLGSDNGNGNGYGNSNRDCVERQNGYTVQYEYAGQRYTTTSARDPGDSIQVQVDRQTSVRPMNR